MTGRRSIMTVTLVVAITVLVLAVALAAARSSDHRHSASRRDGGTLRPAPVATATTVGRPGAAAATTVPAVTTTVPPIITTAPTTIIAPLGPVALTGCPPPPRPPEPSRPPSHPAVLIPESALPPTAAPAPRVIGLDALAGKGMWIWQRSQTEGGNVQTIVQHATAAQLSQLWVRVGDSFDGFYGADWLEALVPSAHRAGLAVIGWGFPYLYDPVGDAAWTAQALAWRSASGDQIDGWSADLETASEGVALSAVRASTYLGLVRPHAAGRPLVATVYPPTDYWMNRYPYQAMAPYIDTFAPMLYWGCIEPGALAAVGLDRLATMAPVHVIGQAYDMGPEGGRVGPPSGAEISRFLDVSRRGGARGASFWAWQHMNAEEWAALSSYPWPRS